MEKGFRSLISGSGVVEVEGTDQTLRVMNFDDVHGNPAGGFCVSKGLQIEWQDGPLNKDGVRQASTGAFVETVLEAVAQRLRYYQKGKFACAENAKALDSISCALEWLRKRTKDRKSRGVEGTHQP